MPVASPLWAEEGSNVRVALRRGAAAATSTPLGLRRTGQPPPPAALTGVDGSISIILMIKKSHRGGMLTLRRRAVLAVRINRCPARLHA